MRLLLKPPSCKNPFLWFAPSLVEVDRSGIGLDPSSVEVIVFVVGYGPYPSSVEVDCCGCLATGLPLSCEAVFERGVRYSIVVTNPPRWRFPRWEIVDWKSFKMVKAGM